MGNLKTTKIEKFVVCIIVLIASYLLFLVWYGNSAAELDSIKWAITIPTVALILLVFIQLFKKYDFLIFKKILLGFAIVLIFVSEKLTDKLLDISEENVPNILHIQILVYILIGIIISFYLSHAKEILFDKTTGITPSPISNADSGKQPVSTQADSNTKNNPLI